MEKNTKKGGPRIFVTNFIDLAADTSYKLWFYNLMVPTIATDTNDADSDKRLVYVTLKALDVSAGWDGTALYEDTSLLGTIRISSTKTWTEGGSNNCAGKCKMIFGTGGTDVYAGSIDIDIDIPIDRDPTRVKAT